MRKLLILIVAVGVSFYAVKNMNGEGGNGGMTLYRGTSGSVATGSLSDYLPDLSTFAQGGGETSGTGTGGVGDLNQIGDQLIAAFPEAFTRQAQDYAQEYAQDALNLVATQSHGEILSNFDPAHPACQGCHDAGKRLSGK